MKVIKKDGTLEEFDGQKIVNAVTKSASRVMVTLDDTQFHNIVAAVVRIIKEAICTRPLEIEPYNDLFDLCREYEKIDFAVAHEWNHALRTKAAFALRSAVRQGTPIVICGTRYSLYDPIGHLQEEMQKQGKRCKIIETPALDPVTDESNFEYMREGKKIFTTQYFRDQRDMLSAEQFESEFQQQDPVQ